MYNIQKSNFSNVFSMTIKLWKSNEWEVGNKNYEFNHLSVLLSHMVFGPFAGASASDQPPEKHYNKMSTLEKYLNYFSN